ncbi:2-oxoglutarate dehydrogenase complex dihydrolipoyllysine-residue succinyltransferase [Acuticoccus sp. MNP-M23]|uniref:2-oxoglutarate dehydrogenase complex dihydrolipoyllysine-residue succinyltransferase n=1 Tax=Acuticoccus sp. MNP-M23 TaxID=3072793 RepID=UPI00281680FB|nr:2-oxoglutarate dehydrogenase complex dihydrolipoyllysine-residue succinyltransferase [Acuticoccus sp. MNP-M23]WMS44901.1 2-oxoglutarate dehydrogenase complex dihydrolipoyllysine-residue succinyltransferase [Acuticoccus sp. MNP-M23]
MSTEIRVPTLGESVTEATVAQWYKSEGDSVSADEPLLELETDKVSVEVPAPAAGKITEITAKPGETVEVGALLGQIGEGAGNSTQKADAPKAEAKSEAPAKADAPAKSAGGDVQDVTVPALGESVTEATVGQFMKKVGDSVAADEAIVELETDKVSVEVPSPVAGVIKSFEVAEGDTIGVGAVIAKVEAGAGGAAQDTDKGGATTKSAAPAESSGDMPAAPSAQKAMKEAGISASQVEGTGKRGQVLKGDVIAALEKGATGSSAEAPAAKRAPSGEDDAAREERVPMSRLRRTIAKRLKDAQNTAAMLTTFNDVDMTAVMDLRKQYKDVFEKKHGTKLGFMAFFSKACVQALRDVPAVNAEIDGNDLVYKNYYHLGIAVGTDKGLVVPVVRDADELSFADIEKTISGFGRRARDGQLKLEEMQGGTFTITNGGIYGSLMSTPILNAPQSGILGMHRIEQRPVAINGEVKIRPMMYLALSYDHRVVDGKEAVTFLVRIKEAIEDPQRLLLDL